jgi:hypothetical protein
MTSAVHDAITLTEALEGNDLCACSKALVAYQRQRFRFVRAREAFAQALFAVFRAKGTGERTLREAVFRYWKCPRARRASMAILSGDESRTRVLATEYARVVMTAVMLGVHATYRDRSLSQSLVPLAGLADGGRTVSRVAIDMVTTAARAHVLRAPAPWVESLTFSRSRPPRRTIPREQSRADERASAE